MQLPAQREQDLMQEQSDATIVAGPASSKMPLPLTHFGQLDLSAQTWEVP
jgi:hypothetical protein